MPEKAEIHLKKIFLKSFNSYLDNRNWRCYYVVEKERLIETNYTIILSTPSYNIYIYKQNGCPEAAFL